MAGGGDLGVPQRGGKKPLDTVINLVPFIDLMAVTIAFLIMTAVWTQVGAISVGRMGPGSLDHEERAAALTVHISESFFAVDLNGAAYEPIPVSTPERLVERLQEIKRFYPDQRAVTVTADDGVKYEVLVRVIDLCLGADLPAVSVSAG